MKKRIGIVSYNIYCNFTNYGSALQSWALCQSIKKIAGNIVEPVLVDYCPEVLADKDPLNPVANMWDKDEESRKMCELTLPAIQENYYKFDKFYHKRFERTCKKYTAQNFNDISMDENITGFVCGSDTIFCIDEFGGFDDQKLNEKLKNFNAIGLRENQMIPYVASHVDVPVQRVIDPTLLLTSNEYDKIADERLENEKYLLLYSRRYNPHMEAYAEKLAAENGWKIVEISLRAKNAEKTNRRMFYEAGVEEFLSLTKYAECVVTNSFHGAIFAVQYSKPFYVFSRELCDTKIKELLALFGLTDHLLVSGAEDKGNLNDINYEVVHSRIAEARKKSLEFLHMELTSCF